MTKKDFTDPHFIMGYWDSIEAQDPDISTERLIQMCADMVMENADMDYLKAHDVVMNALKVASEERK